HPLESAVVAIDNTPSPQRPTLLQLVAKTATLGRLSHRKLMSCFSNTSATAASKTFGATKVREIQFVPDKTPHGASDPPSPGRPVSATWCHKDGSTRAIRFEYLVDESGSSGLVSTKYLKNRRYNQGLNIANWGYWKGSDVYGVGTFSEGRPCFEALKGKATNDDWVWFIPLHDVTHYAGIVQMRDMAVAKRQSDSPSSKEFCTQSLNLVPGIKNLLSNAEPVSDVKSASDWSYSTSSHAFPYMHIAGDAGASIDPFFSSDDDHLAFAGGLSPAVTIATGIRGEYAEATAASWHNKKTPESYTPFLLVFVSALKQIRSQDKPVPSDVDEESFDRAFDLFRPGRDLQNRRALFPWLRSGFLGTEGGAHPKLKKRGLDADANNEHTQKPSQSFNRVLLRKNAKFWTP
ncbi:Tryptophan 2-halogenase, partial [Tolypocladium ophioglossoides CBS 100239]